MENNLNLLNNNENNSLKLDYNHIIKKLKDPDNVLGTIEIDNFSITEDNDDNA